MHSQDAIDEEVEETDKQDHTVTGGNDSGGAFQPLGSNDYVEADEEESYHEVGVDRSSEDADYIDDDMYTGPST